MKARRTQLICWFTGEPETQGSYIVKVKLKDENVYSTFIADWTDKRWVDQYGVISEPVVEWTPIP